MTANELADILENRCEEHQLNASYMLRQQKAEIDRLTMLCDCMTTESNRKGNEIEKLKAHPVKELALTDEEMISIYEKDWSGIKCGLGRAVEQAILRNAQEK